MASPRKKMAVPRLERKSEGDGKVHIAFRATQDQRAGLRMIAVKKRKTVQRLLEELVDGYVARHSG